MEIVMSLGTISLVMFPDGHYAIFDEMEYVESIGHHTSRESAKASMVQYYLTETLEGQIIAGHAGDHHCGPEVVEGWIPHDEMVDRNGNEWYWD